MFVASIRSQVSSQVFGQRLYESQQTKIDWWGLHSNNTRLLKFAFPYKIQPYSQGLVDLRVIGIHEVVFWHYSFIIINKSCQIKSLSQGGNKGEL